MGSGVLDMREYRYALSVTGQFFFCGLPFRLDTTSICSFGCRYCFSTSRGGLRAPGVQVVNVDRIARKLRRTLSEECQTLDVNGELLRHRVPIHMGGISDPFCNDIATQRSIELLGVLSEHHYPVVISTKNPIELTSPEVVGLLSTSPPAVIQVSFSTSNERLAKIAEPNAPSVRERLEYMSILSNQGINVFARLQPLFLPWIDEVVDQLIPQLAQVGCKHISVEFLKLPVERNLSSAGEMFEDIGWEAYRHYLEHGASLVGREWVLPPLFKYEALQPVVDAIHGHSMTYGAADIGLTHLGDTDCCCGIDTLPGYENWFNANFSNIIRSSQVGHISFRRVLEAWTPKRSVAMYMNSRCRPSTGVTVTDCLRDKWNRPGTTNAPDTHLGVAWHGDHDENGDCLYVKSLV